MCYVTSSLDNYQHLIIYRHNTLQFLPTDHKLDAQLLVMKPPDIIPHK